MPKLSKKKGIIVAFDMEDTSFAIKLAEELNNAEGNFAIKIGRPLEMQIGKTIISKIKEVSDLPIIYDGKIADIPYISKIIAKDAYDSGADAVIMHAFLGSDAIMEIKDLGGGDVIIVIEMSHKGSDEFIGPISEKMTGFVKDFGINGVVLPATKPDRVKKLSKMIGDAYIISPGIKTQGGIIGGAILAGADYEVVGRAIYEAKRPKEAAEEIYKRAVRKT